MKNDPSQVPLEYSDYSKRPKPAVRAKYDEFLAKSLYQSICKDVERMVEILTREAFLEGWMAAGGESPYVTAKGVRLDPRTLEEPVAEEKLLLRED